jgi:hypothetical protein
MNVVWVFLLGLWGSDHILSNSLFQFPKTKVRTMFLSCWNINFLYMLLCQNCGRYRSKTFLWEEAKTSMKSI